MDVICGILERITYYNEENDFLVAKLKEKGKKDLTTVVGNLAGLNPGESLKLYGRWVHNYKYGPEFRVEKYEVVVPATVHGIEKYLGSGLIKGIGPVMARRIVSLFGLDTLEVIENRPEELSRVGGIGEKRIAMIVRAWQEQKEIKDIMVFLQGHGVSAAHAAKIYKKYGSESIRVVKENPYRLAADIHGIGFITADRIARSLGIDPRSVMRAEEGLVYFLNGAADQGHTCYPLEEAIKETASLLEVEPDIVREAAESLIRRGRAVTDTSGSGEKMIYLAPFYAAETLLAQRLARLACAVRTSSPFDVQKAVTWAEKRLGVELAEKQKQAVELALQKQVLVITGGPGTGKTTIIRAIIEILAALRQKVVLAAPTGRAAKRMQEATGREAKTVHRLLEYNPQKGGFTRDQQNPLEADAVILDEVSMIDVLLMHHLLKAVPPRASLILVGDTNQLPSVGPGTVLKDIVESGCFETVTLNEIFRQAKESKIVTNAHLINAGKFPDLRRPPENVLGDFYFIEEEEPEKIVKKIVALCAKNIPARYSFHPLKEIQVLAPMNRGQLGVGALNEVLSEALNPAGQKLTRGHKTFKVGDKVMQVVNNYQKEVFNGDIGFVISFDEEEQELRVDFDGRAVVYDFSELDELVLAYAISVHKSQGSEYPAVVMPVVTQHFLMLQRNLLYTAITRGKKLVVLLGTKKALAIAVKNNKTQKRYGLLKERLAGEHKEHAGCDAGGLAQVLPAGRLWGEGEHGRGE